MVALLLLSLCLAAAEPLTVRCNPQGAGEAPRTLLAALEAARAARGDSRRPTVIELGAGVYELAEPLLLGPADSGLTIRAAAGARVVIRGGRAVSGWQPRGDGVYVADLKAQGLGEARFHQLYHRGRRQVLARYPNLDPEHPRTGGFLLVHRRARQPRQAFIYEPGSLPLEGWEDLSQAELVSVYAGGWNYAITPITRIDRERGAIEFRPVRNRFERLNRYYLQNFPAALDAPGEWYHDRGRGELLFRTPDGLPPGEEVVVPLVDQLVDVAGRIAYPHGYLHTRHRGDKASFPLQTEQPDQPVEEVHFRGLTFEVARQDGLRLRGVRRASVVGCTVENVGGVGINLGGVASAYAEVGSPRLTPAVGEPMGVGGAGQDFLAQDPCQEVRVVGCDVSQTGSDGIFLYGTRNLAENNHVHDTGLDDKDCAGINLFGEEHVARRNLIHDLPRNAIFLKGTGHLVELNDIHHTLLETCDGGAIRMCQRNLTLRDNIIRHNRIVDTIGYGFPGGQNLYRSPYFGWAVYLDDFTCGTRVEGNLIVRAGRGGIHVHGGSDNLVADNVVVDAAEAQIEVNAIDDTARGNIIRGNALSYDAARAELHRLIRPVAEAGRFVDNTCWPRGGPVRAQFGQRRIEGWEAWLAEPLSSGERLLDPRLGDPAGPDWRLPADSPLQGTAVAAIPVGQIGLYAAPERASWPVDRGLARLREAPVLYQREAPPLAETFEEETVGAAPGNGDVMTGAGAKIEVVADQAAAGRQSLRFTDAPGLPNPWQPRIYWGTDFKSGTVRFECDLRLDAAAPPMVAIDFRDYGVSGLYDSGALISITPAGELQAGGTTLGRLPLATWVRLSVELPLASERPVARLVLAVPGQQEVRAEVPSPGAGFRALERVVVMSNSLERAVFWLDNVFCRRLP